MSVSSAITIRFGRKKLLSLILGLFRLIISPILRDQRFKETLFRFTIVGTIMSMCQVLTLKQAVTITMSHHHLFGVMTLKRRSLWVPLAPMLPTILCRYLLMIAAQAARWISQVWHSFATTQAIVNVVSKFNSIFMHQEMTFLQPKPLPQCQPCFQRHLYQALCQLWKWRHLRSCHSLIQRLLQHPVWRLRRCVLRLISE